MAQKRKCVCSYMKLFYVPVDINGLQQAERHPGPQEEHMVTEDHDADEETSTEDKCLSRVGIFCLHAKRRLRGTEHRAM